MSKLGDYIHYSWKNYKQYGVNKEEPSNFNPMIFAYHRQEILSNIQSMVEIKNLQALEEKYNTGAKHLNTFLKQSIEAIKNPTNDNNFLKQLLTSISSTWAAEVDSMLENLKWDDKRQIIIYDPKITPNMISTDEQAINKIMSSFERTRGVHVDILLNHLVSIQGKINRLEDGELKTSLKQECEKFIRILEGGIQGDQAQGEAVMQIWQKSSSTKYKKGFLSIAQEKKLGKQGQGLLQGFLQKIQVLTSRLQSAVYVQTRIRGILAEQMGHVISNNLNNLTYESLSDAFKDFIATGGKTAGAAMTKPLSNGISSVQFISNLDQNLMRQTMAHQGKFASALQQHDFKAGQIYYSLKPFSDQVAQKTDFVLTVNDNTPVGVSMKNYDMSEVSYYEQGIGNVPSGIDLQKNSSLSLYLAGIELEHPRLGTHYLQILSGQRGYENGKYRTEIQTMRKQANEALALYILWSAATGRGQGRGTGTQFADILAIYDKQKTTDSNFRRIRLYSIRSLIQKIVDTNTLSTAAIFSPSILDNKLILTNRYIGKQPSEEAATTRITELLMHAHSQIIKVSLSKMFLNSFPDI